MMEPMTEPTTETAMKPTMELTLCKLLEDLVSEVDSSNTNNIINGLERQGVTSWNGFVQMDKKDITKMTNLSNFLIRIVGHIKQLIRKTMQNNVPGATLASLYTREMLDDYIDASM